MSEERTCLTDGCGRGGRLRRGLCDRCYQHQRTIGTIQRVSERSCSFDGCNSPHYARGYCQKHYRREQAYGDADTLKNHRAPAECTVEGCAKVPLAKGLCAMHRARIMKYGDPEAGAFQPRGTCEIPGCDRPHEARGLCGRHYGRWLRHGDPDRLVKPLPLDQQNYQGMHRRLKVTRGLAAYQVCEHCGGPAAHWAYDHQDPDELPGPRGFPYSQDPAHYLPLCARCHLAFDRRTPA